MTYQNTDTKLKNKGILFVTTKNHLMYYFIFKSHTLPKAPQEKINKRN